MKQSAIKRWIFTALLLALIVGTIMGHAHAAPMEFVCADQRHVAAWDDSPIALQQKLDEIAKGKQTLGDGATAEAVASLPASGLLPLDILFLTRLQ